MTGEERRIAGRFSSPFLRSYARGKLRSDPVYAAVLDRIRHSSAPLLDIGCGVGLLEFFLREHGVGNDIVAWDHDARKVAQATDIARAYERLTFRVGDARDPMPSGHNVILIDVLHYFSAADQRQILENAVRTVPVGGLILIRDAIRDGTLRYRITAAQEGFSRLIRWLRAERLNFPSRAQVAAPFAGFIEEAVPMWGHTPFNNYLFVFRRSGDGITKR